MRARSSARSYAPLPLGPRRLVYLIGGDVHWRAVNERRDIGEREGVGATEEQRGARAASSGRREDDADAKLQRLAI